MRACAVVLAAAVALVGPARAQSRDESVADLLSRVGGRIADYYSRARTIVSRESVRLQPLDRRLQPAGEWRQLIYDVRVDWDPSRPGAPSVTRELVSAGGRIGTLTGRDGECFDLRGESPEPLSMLLPERQKGYTFTVDGSDSSKRVAVLRFTYNEPEPPKVTWQGSCGTIDLKGSTVGRVWIDRASGTVLRIDERLPRPLSYVIPLDAILDRQPVAQTVDRLETSVRYEAVTFRDPDETVMMPASVRTLAVIHNSGVPQLLTLQTYGRYRRFMTGGRLVK